MRALSRPKLIPLIASLVVMVIFALTFLTATPRNEMVRKSESMMSMDAAAPSSPPAVAPPEAAKPTASYMSQQEAPAEIAAPSEPAAPSAGTIDAIKPVEVSLPKLAYAYTLGFRLAGDRIAAAQDAHRHLCTRMGPMRCQLVELRRGEADDAATSATLKLRVASSEADAFSDTLIRAIAKEGGRATRTDVVAEDVSKAVGDAVARIHQREMLVARLTDILRNRRGNVAELVDAERSVAAAQEELDQTRGWLAELRGRVAMSNFEISYQAVAPQAAPQETDERLGESILRSAANFLISMRSILTLLIYLAPWMLLAIPLFLGIRAFLRRLERAMPAANAAEEAGGPASSPN